MKVINKEKFKCRKGYSIKYSLIEKITSQFSCGFCKKNRKQYFALIRVFYLTCSPRLQSIDTSTRRHIVAIMLGQRALSEFTIRFRPAVVDRCVFETIRKYSDNSWNEESEWEGTKQTAKTNGVVVYVGADRYAVSLSKEERRKQTCGGRARYIGVEMVRFLDTELRTGPYPVHRDLLPTPVFLWRGSRGYTWPNLVVDTRVSSMPHRQRQWGGLRNPPPASTIRLRSISRFRHRRLLQLCG